MDKLHRRFWKNVDILGDDDCWEWKMSRNKQGYGWVRNNKKITLSHRCAWMYSNGEIPEGMFVCHHCDNPPCCNPKHLFIGTHKDNMQDMVMKGRGRKRKSNKERTDEILTIDTDIKRGYNKYMKDKSENRTKFWKVRVTEDEIKMRKELADRLGKTESEIDRRLWNDEAERIKNGRERLAAPDSIPDSDNGKYPAVVSDQGRLRLYTIPMWDEKGNAQLFIEKPTGKWLDVQRECMVTEDYVIKYVSGYERAILSYL